MGREQGAHHPDAESFKRPDSLELKQEHPQKSETEKVKPDRSFRLVKREDPIEHQHQIQTTKERAQVLAQRNEERQETTKTYVGRSSDELKESLAEIPRWQFWRKDEKAQLQAQLDVALESERQKREAKQNRLKEIHKTLNDEKDGPLLKPFKIEKLIQQRDAVEGPLKKQVQKELNKAYTQMVQERQQQTSSISEFRFSPQETSVVQREEPTTKTVQQEINTLKEELRQLSWWKVTEKALVARRIQTKEAQLVKLQSEPKKEVRSPFEHEERILRELTARRNALSGTDRDLVNESVSASFTRLQELRQKSLEQNRSSTASSVDSENRKAA